NFVLQFPPGTNVNLTGGKADFNPAIPATVITLPAGVTIPPGAVFQITATSANTATGGTSVTGGLSEPIATLKADFDHKANAATGALSGVSDAINSATGTVSGAIGDATSYPFLTEQVNLSARGPSTAGYGGSSGAVSLAQTVGVALQQVLGWKVRDDDPKGFVG